MVWRDASFFVPMVYHFKGLIMMTYEELEPYFHDEMLWIPKDQKITKQVNMDEILKRIEENESN